MPEKTPVGMAIQITEDNIEKIAIVNGGIVPKIEEHFHTGTFFVYPYAPDAQTSILPGYAFRENWRFVETPSYHYFTEIVEI